MSVHRTPAGPRGSLASELAAALGDRGDLPEAVPDHGPDHGDDEALPERASAAGRAGDAAAVSRRRTERSEWLAERQRVLAAARRSRTVSATALAAAAAGSATDEHPLSAPPSADDDGSGPPDRSPLGPDTRAGDDPGLAKAPRNLDLPAWQKGRYGTAIGRAVHGVLQTCDLVSGRDIDPAAAAQAAAEGILGQEEVVARLARSALVSTTVRAAVQQRHWREVFVAAPVGDRLLEGYVDLLYESDDGLVVVDYKTDVVHDEADLDAKVARYGVQAAAYAVALEAATGIDVAHAVLVFLTETEPIDVVVPDIDAARSLAVSTAASIDLGTRDPDD